MTIRQYRRLAGGLVALVLALPALALAAPIPIALSRVVLRSNTTLERSDGSLFIRALVNDNDAGTLEADILAGTTSIEIADSGSFTLTLDLAGCSQGGGPGHTISCPVARGRVMFYPVFRFPLLYRMVVSQRSLGAAVAGTVTPLAPVTVTLHQSSNVRPDNISNCRAGKMNTVCNEP